MNFLNPYSYIGGAIILAAIGGSLWYQGTQIHHWHTKYDADEKAIAVKDEQIRLMTVAQDNQTAVTGAHVSEVITVPGPVQTVVKTIHDAPIPTDCSTPVLSEDIKNEL